MALQLNPRHIRHRADAPADALELVNGCLEPKLHPLPAPHSEPPPNQHLLCQRGAGWAPRRKARRVFDASLLFDEVDLLEARLHELNSVVDVFIVAEANTTHQGVSKEMSFARNRARFEPFLHKITHVPVAFPDCTAWSWICENYQRDILMQGLLKHQLEPDDVVMVSDGDEVPRASAVAALRWCDFENGLQHSRLLRLHATVYWYSSHCRLSNRSWQYGTGAATGKFVSIYGTQQLRTSYNERSPSKAQWQAATGLFGSQLVLRTVGYTRYGRTFKRLRVRCSNAQVQGYYGDFRKNIGRCSSGQVEEYAMADAGWHWSYFKSPEAIAAKCK